MEYTAKFISALLTSWFPTLILRFLYSISFLSMTPVTIALLSRILSAARFHNTINDKHYKNHSRCQDNMEPMGESPLLH